MKKSKHEEENKEDDALLKKDGKSAVDTHTGTERMSATPLSSLASRLSRDSESRRERGGSQRQQPGQRGGWSEHETQDHSAQVVHTK